MHYRDWWATFNPYEYLAGLAEEGVDGADEKLTQLSDAKKAGFEAVQFHVLNEADRGVCNRVSGLSFMLELDRFEYNTTRHGPGHAHMVYVLCKDTGKKDAHNRTIYRTPEDIVFVKEQKAGSPSNFGSCELTQPAI